MLLTYVSDDDYAENINEALWSIQTHNENYSGIDAYGFYGMLPGFRYYQGTIFENENGMYWTYMDEETESWRLSISSKMDD